jgi:hypothetical protein
MKEPSTPGPIASSVAETRLHRVFEDVSRSLCEVLLVLDEIGLESLLEKMASTSMTRVEALGIKAIQTVHSAR